MNYTVADDKGFFHITVKPTGDSNHTPYTEEELAELPLSLIDFCSKPGQGIRYPEDDMKKLKLVRIKMTEAHLSL